MELFIRSKKIQTFFQAVKHFTARNRVWADHALIAQRHKPRRTIMTSNPTNPTSSHFQLEWPGCQRWEMLMDQFREQLSGIDEWWSVQRVRSGELGISEPPAFEATNDYSEPRPSEERWVGVGFASSWTLLTN
jgi:hypothetical protein